MDAVAPYEIKKSNNLYSIHFEENTNTQTQTQILLESILPILGAGAYITNTNTITFHGLEIETLQDFLTMKNGYQETNDLLICLKNQIENLEKKKKTFYTFQLNRILVIKKTLEPKYVFIYVNLVHLIEIDADKALIKFMIPFPINQRFLNPEIKKIKKLPSYSHYKSIYYSLGAVALLSLFGEGADVENYEKTMEPILYTNLYWTISRLLQNKYYSSK